MKEKLSVLIISSVRNSIPLCFWIETYRSIFVVSNTNVSSRVFGMCPDLGNRFNIEKGFSLLRDLIRKSAEPPVLRTTVRKSESSNASVTFSPVNLRNSSTAAFCLPGSVLIITLLRPLTRPSRPSFRLSSRTTSTSF